MTEPFSPARAIWDNRHRLAEAKAEFDQVRDTLQRATGGPRDLVRQQWLQIVSMVYDFKPDLIIELGRGYGNSTLAMAFAAKLLRPQPCRIVSLCLANSYRTVSLPFLKANLADKSLLDPVEALEADILSFDFEPMLASAKRVFVFWDAHGFDVAQTILTGILRPLQDRPHVAIIHDMADLDAFPSHFRGFDQAGEWLKYGSASPKYVLGSVGAQYEEGVALVDFASRNQMRLLSAESSYFGELNAEQVAELDTLFGPDFAQYGFWYYFSLNQATGPLSFPERPVAIAARSAGAPAPAGQSHPAQPAAAPAPSTAPAQPTSPHKALAAIMASGALDEDPFVLLDAGCSGGINSSWRAFGDAIQAYGFDPQQSECARLRAAETRPGVEYIASFVGLPKDHAFLRQKQQEDDRVRPYFEPWSRLSAAEAARLDTTAPQQGQAIHEDHVSPDTVIGLDEFVRARNLRTVDFIKIDVDGTDVQVLLSAESILASHEVLGFSIEVNFQGTHLDTENTFHTIDRLMRRFGYVLVDLSHRGYSRHALPLPFQFDILAQTEGGQPIQGDAIYLRDAASPHEGLLWERPLGPQKLLKLAGLFELFGLPDMAAELLVAKRPLLERLVSVDALLDALTPPLNGKTLSYSQYIAAFRADPTILMPKNRPAPAQPAQPAQPLLPTWPTEPGPVQSQDSGEALAKALADGSAEAGRDWLPWLGTAAVGRKVWEGIAVSEGAAGYLCDGPYWTLKPGRYVMRVALQGPATAPEGAADIGVVDIANHVDEVASLRIEGSHLAAGEIAMPFAIPEAADGRPSRVEARVRSSGACGFSITAVRIEPAPAEPVIEYLPAPDVAPPEPVVETQPGPPLSLKKRIVIAVTPPILLRILRRLWRMLRGKPPVGAGQTPAIDANRLYD